MVEEIYSHLGQIRHRAEVVEFRVEQHEAVLGDRLRALRAGKSEAVWHHGWHHDSEEAENNNASRDEKSNEAKVLRQSGRPDLNRGPPAPEAGALTGLRYAPSFNQCALEDSNL